MNKLLLSLSILLCTYAFGANLHYSTIKKETGTGSTLLVVGGIHGDEPGGYFAPMLLAKHYKIESGNLWIVPNLNFDSIIKNSRGINGDMNRKFAKIETKDKDLVFLKNLNLLSAKPVLYVINCSSDKKIIDYPASAKPALELDVKLENELSELDFEAAKDMREAMPHPKNSIDELISTCYDLLGLDTFLTTGEDETRAWTIAKGSRAPQAAGKIHSDFEKGFIRADIIFWEKLLAAGSWNQAKENGLIKTEGKEYVVKDGDVVVFKFNN